MNDTKMLANDDDFISFSLSRFASLQAMPLFVYLHKCLQYEIRFLRTTFIKHKSGFKSWLNLSLERESWQRDEMKGVDEWNEMIS